jgi:hypothetical protein
MNLQRLRQMDLAEIAGRSRMEASKWWERMAASGARRRPGGDAAERRHRLEAFRETAPGRFFAGAADERTAALLSERVPGALREVIAGAERTLTSRFDLLGYRDLSFGDPVDWHLEPVSQRRAPRVHWSRLDPIDVAAVGDSKVVWELNRHQWVAELGQAYRMTGDERYAEAFATHVSGWLYANPAGQGINWASSLEVALRLIAWCWALVLFRRSPALSPQLFARMSASLEDHAAHVERYLSRYFSPNTHLTGEALGLVYAGTVFPGTARARRWRECGARILADETARQVLPDGVYFEQSTCYQRYTVEIALHFLILCARNGLGVPAGLDKRVQAMLDFLLAVRSPRGEAPPIGDADGGWLLPLARRAPGDLRGVFGVAAALFGRADYAWAAEGGPPELLWLLGPAGLARFESLLPAPPSGSPSSLHADGGYAVMRDRWGAEGHQLIFDVGPLGCPVSGGHGHADLLSIQCTAFGEPFLVDPGTGTYADEAWRSFFRGTAAHSTVTVDGVGQALPVGPFSWQQRPRARLRRWLSTEAIDFADAEHDAYGRLPDPVRHRRRVLFVKPRYWVLLDDLVGAGWHRIELRFQFGPVEVSLEPGSWTRAVAGGRALLLRPFAEVPLETRLRRGSQKPVEGWISPDYGRREPAPVVVYSASTLLPLRIVTLILPSADPGAPLPAVSPLMRGGEELVGLVFDAGRETVSTAPDGRLVHSYLPDLGS